MAKSKKDNHTNNEPAKTSQKTNNTGGKLSPEVQKLTDQLAEQKEITQRAQSDYFRLKVDMDAYIARAQQAQKGAKVDALITMGTQILPGVTQLKQSLQHIPADIADNKRVGSIELIYKKTLQDIEQLGIYPLEPEVGEEPDLTLHAPVNTQEIDDKKLKGKIVQVIEMGRKYEKDETLKVIIPAKIVVGA